MKKRKENRNKLLKIHRRLEQIKEEKFLTNRIFPRISENMHYEIFKYLNSEELLQIRRTKLGGYQLTSNRILRSRIQNFMPYLYTKLELEGPNSDVEINLRKCRLLFGQIQNEELRFCYPVFVYGTSIMTGVMIKNEGVKELVKIFKFMPQLTGLYLCKLFLSHCW